MDSAIDLIFLKDANGRYVEGTTVKLWPADLTITVIGFASIDEAKTALGLIRPALDNAGKILKKDIRLGLLLEPPVSKVLAVDGISTGANSIVIILSRDFEGDARGRYRKIVESTIGAGVGSFLAGQHPAKDLFLTYQVASVQGFVRNDLVFVRRREKLTDNILPLTQWIVTAMFGQATGAKFAETAINIQNGVPALTEPAETALKLLYLPCVQAGMSETQFRAALSQQP